MEPEFWLIALALFSLIVLFHELGHFVVAKLVGIRVLEFSVGMGPFLIGRKVGDTLYSLRLVPILAYNKMAGMELEDLDDPQGFDKKSVGQRVAVIASGSLMNFALAIVLYALIFLALGVPSNSTTVGRVLPGRPAEAAGLAAGDRIIAVEGNAISTWEDLVTAIHQRPGQWLHLTVQRGETRFGVAVRPEFDPETKVGVIGIEQTIVRLGPLGALWQGIKQAGLVLKLIITGFVQMVLGKVPADLIGPVGIVQFLGQAARFGAANVMGFAALISLSLGFFNLFPIPALDGSRLCFLAVEWLRGKPVDPRKENMVHLVGFAVLIIFSLVITYRDLLRIFG